MIGLYTAWHGAKRHDKCGKIVTTQGQLCWTWVGQPSETIKEQKTKGDIFE